MNRVIRRLAGAVTLAAMTTPASAQAQTYWQCAPFARTVSGIDLFGAAASWWQKAVGRYAQGSLPRAGAVMVFRAISSMRSGHVATVSRIVSERAIEVTHANWSPIGGRRGRVERDVRVEDVSSGNDWSRVKVWWAPLRDLGTRAYPVAGFIYGKQAPMVLIAPPPPPVPSIGRTPLVSLALLQVTPCIQRLSSGATTSSKMPVTIAASPICQNTAA